MKSIKIKNYFFSTLVVCGLLLTASQAALAAKGGKTPPAPPVEIHAVMVELFNGRIVVTGNGLNTVDTSAVSLGGFPIPLGDIFYNADNSSLELAFSAGMEAAVSAPGNYLLTLNGTSMSVYFTSPVFDPDTAGCPCEGFWRERRLATPSLVVKDSGFAGLTPYCTFESVSGDQVAVQFFNESLYQLWILTSEFNDSATECALVNDEPIEQLNTPQQHEACSAYLKTTYIDTSSAPDCGSLSSFP